MVQPLLLLFTSSSQEILTLAIKRKMRINNAMEKQTWQTKKRSCFCFSRCHLPYKQSSSSSSETPSMANAKWFFISLFDLCSIWRVELLRAKPPLPLTAQLSPLKRVMTSLIPGLQDSSAFRQPAAAQTIRLISLELFGVTLVRGSSKVSSSASPWSKSGFACNGEKTP